MIPAPRQSLAPYVRQRLGSGLLIAQAQFLAAIKDPAFHDLCIKRYEEGEREHAGHPSWLTWPIARFEAEAVQEIADFANYHTMELVARDFREAA